MFDASEFVYWLSQERRLHMKVVRRRHALSFLSSAFILGIVKLAPADSAPSSLDAILRESAAVIVATVVDVDPRAGNETDPMTRVSLEVSDVIRGKLPAGSRHALLFRGGELPNGAMVSYSDVVELSVAERYILFVRSEYYISPLVQAPGAVLRVAQLEGKEVVVNAAGHGVVLSALHGLVSAGPVAAPLGARQAELLKHVGRAGRPEVARSKRALALSSPLSTIVSEFKQRSKKVTARAGSFPVAPKPWPAGYQSPSSRPSGQGVPR
jgi:hypothetical protein